MAVTMKELRPPNTATRARRNTVLVAIGVPLAFLLVAALSGGGRVLVPGLAILTFAVVPLSVLALEGPSRMRYLVGDGALEARTMFGSARFELRGATAQRYTPGRLWRVAGTAMPGYYTGRWREAGRAVRVYATTFVNAVLITTPTTRVLVSPTEPDAFLEALRAEGARVDAPRAPSVD